LRCVYYNEMIATQNVRSAKRFYNEMIATQNVRSVMTGTTAQLYKNLREPLQG